MRIIKVFRIVSGNPAEDRYVGQFPWLESQGLKAALWWAYHHGYGSGVVVRWS